MLERNLNKKQRYLAEQTFMCSFICPTAYKAPFFLLHHREHSFPNNFQINIFPSANLWSLIVPSGNVFSRQSQDMALVGWKSRNVIIVIRLWRVENKINACNMLSRSDKHRKITMMEIIHCWRLNVGCWWAATAAAEALYEYANVWNELSAWGISEHGKKYEAVSMKSSLVRAHFVRYKIAEIVVE